MMENEVHQADTFLYFAYSANIFTFRMKMFNPNAEFVSIGRLDNYRLHFFKYSKFWGGPRPTLVPTANAQIWGVIWRLRCGDLISLDDHKGVNDKMYFVKYVDVLTPYLGTIRCRAYMLREYPLPRGNREMIPLEQRPSWACKQVMIMGALEHRLPRHYIKFLKRLKDNGEEGGIRTLCLIMRYGKNMPCECRVPGKLLRKPLKLTLRDPNEVRKFVQSPYPLRF
ncbi:unnamed protein product [Chrysodeixis includens]|uniref:gamma-glutamylcyclotransferase n=1 Tax=Chrysodeixis includens TaxID=689277 RepID=A0A9P0BRA2_CHRIL|nr:unnamed protein product [Chrysodeixis includens]